MVAPPEGKVNGTLWPTQTFPIPTNTSIAITSECRRCVRYASAIEYRPQVPLGHGAADLVFQHIAKINYTSRFFWVIGVIGVIGWLEERGMVDR